jgi:hypothetical protein
MPSPQRGGLAARTAGESGNGGCLFASRTWRDALSRCGEITRPVSVSHFGGELAEPDCSRVKRDVKPADERLAGYRQPGTARQNAASWRHRFALPERSPLRKIFLFRCGDCCYRRKPCWRGPVPRCPATGFAWVEELRRPVHSPGTRRQGNSIHQKRTPPR